MYVCQWAWQCFHGYNGMCRWRLTCQSCKLDSGTRRGIGCSIMNPSRKRKSKRLCTRKWCHFSVSWSETPHQETLVSSSFLTSLFIFSPSFPPSLPLFISFPPLPLFFILLFLSLPPSLPPSLPSSLFFFQKGARISAVEGAVSRRESPWQSALHKICRTNAQSSGGRTQCTSEQTLTPYSASLSLMLVQITRPKF